MANGIVNLSPEKERVVAEIARLLKPGGRFTGAEITLTRDVPFEERATIDDWFR
jgi:ubiquinone/menaquinone biosynthesis C-methylase UbiE